MQRGFSIIEMLIAMAIAAIVISGVVVSSGGVGTTLRGYQSTVVNGQTNAEATAIAQQMLEQEQGFARQDFNQVSSWTSAQVSGSLSYTKTLTVTEPYNGSYLSKLVIATVSWLGDHGQTLSTQLSTLVTNLENVNSPNTCGSALTGNWQNAQLAGPFNVDNAGSNASGNPVTDVEAFMGKLYITTNNQHGHNEDFYIYDVSADPKNPTLVKAVEFNGVVPGFNALAMSTSTTAAYAYLANANDPNFFSCIASQSCAQVQVIDVTSPASPVRKALFKFATTTAPYVWGNTTGSNSQAVGKAIFYKDDYLYVGLSTTQNGPSFHIIDVHNPLAPTYVASWPAATANFGVSGAPINGVYVRGRYAYLSHPNGLVGAASEQLTVLDVSNPASPVRVGGYTYATGIGGNGKSFAIVGSTLFFGRTASNISGAADSIPEFFILNGTDPAAIPPAPTGSVALPTGESLVGITVRDYLAFLIMNSYFQIWNTSDPTAPALSQSFDLTSTNFLGSGSNGSASDCEGNVIYIGGYRANNDKGALLVAYPGFTYALSNGGDISAVQGASGNTSITETVTSGTPAPTTLPAPTGLPTGASAIYSNNPCTPTCTSQLTISTSYPATPIGTYPISITNAGQTTSFNLIVGAAFTYNLSANPTSKSLSRGSSYTETITATKQSGSAIPVTITLSGFQNNVSASPASATCAPNPTCSVNFTITAAANAQRVTRTITASGSAPVTTTTFSLTIP